MFNRILLFLISIAFVLTAPLSNASAQSKEPSIHHEVKYRILSDDLVEVQMIVHAETDGEWTLSINGAEADSIERGGDDGHNNWAKARIPVKKTKNDQYRIYTKYTGAADPYHHGGQDQVTLENELTFSMKDWQFKFEPVVVGKNRLGGKFIDADQVKGSWFIHVYEPDVDIKQAGSICAGGKRDYSGTQLTKPFICWGEENKPGKYRMQVMFDGKVDGQDISLNKNRLIHVDKDGEIFYADGEPKESDPDPNPDYNYSLLVLTGLLAITLGVIGWWWLRKRKQEIL